jgi:hypothetical protein
VVKPARQRAREDPASHHAEVYRLLDEARQYFWSRAGRFPSWREALILFAGARLEQAGIEPAIVRSAVQECESPASSHYLAAQWIVYPEAPWTESGQTRPGLREELRSEYAPGSSGRARPDPPPSTGPSSGPEAPPTEQEEKAEAMVRYYGEEICKLEEEVRVLERLLAAKRLLLSSYLESRSKYEAQTRAAKERARGEQAAREEAEREARGRRAREARGRRARQESEQSGRARTGDKAQTPWWAKELGITAPFTFEQIKAAYRARSMVTHPDRGGSDAAFARLKRAYDEACLKYATRP